MKPRMAPDLHALGTQIEDLVPTEIVRAADGVCEEKKVAMYEYFLSRGSA